MYVFFGSCLRTALYTGFLLALGLIAAAGGENSYGRGYYGNVNYLLHFK